MLLPMPSRSTLTSPIGPDGGGTGGGRLSENPSRTPPPRTLVRVRVGLAPRKTLVLDNF